MTKYARNHSCVCTCSIRELLNPGYLQKPAKHVIWSCKFNALAQSEQFIQRYLGIFRDIDSYLATLIGKQQRGRVEISPALSENQKQCSDFGKKGPECAHLWVQFSIKNVALRWEKKPQKVPLCSLFFLCFWQNVYWSILDLNPLPPPALENFWLCTCTQDYSFCKTLRLKCLTVFRICLSW